MPDQKPGGSFALSRRGLLGGAVVAPAVARAGAASPPDDVVALCDAWLADEAELDRLTERWMTIESWLVEQHRWFELSEDQQQALPEAAELHAIDRRIAMLLERRVARRARLPTLVATEARGVAAKLAVAVKVIAPEDDPETHRLLAGALRELAGMRCAGCGAALVEGEEGSCW